MELIFAQRNLFLATPPFVPTTCKAPPSAFSVEKSQIHSRKHCRESSGNLDQPSFGRRQWTKLSLSSQVNYIYTSLLTKNQRIDQYDDFKVYGTSSKATASNYEGVAKTLRDRKFFWRPVKMDVVHSQSNNISFSYEWNEFISHIAKITGITPSEIAATKKPWDYFEHVINPGRGYEYRYEHSFDTALFDALRSSLDDFVDSSVPETNWIVLKNSHIGFGRKIRRPTLGFESGYAASSDSEYDHGCFVLGKDIRERTSNTKKRTSSDVMEEDAVWFNDMTAVVELKLEKTSCQHFTTKHNDLNEPNLRKLHGPMSQAIMYSMDVWHCLARRGISAKSVPVVVLAGKSKASNKDYICCLEAHIQIPEYCGDAFLYSIDRLVSFNGSTGLSTNEAVSKDMSAACLKSRNERAIAIYIRTMRIGLEHAVEVIKNRSTSNAVHLPVSLCCHQLFDADGIIAPLIASPIPCEDHLRKSVIHVHQGELFLVTNPTKAMFSGIIPIDWFADTEREDARLTSNCHVKVSCVSVHSTYISHSDCREALKSLHDACMNNTIFKKELAKVLLGYSHANRLVPCNIHEGS